MLYLSVTNVGPLQKPSGPAVLIPLGTAVSETASWSPSAAWTLCQGQAAAPFQGPRVLGRASEPGLPARPRARGGDERCTARCGAGGVRLAPLGAHLASTGLRRVLVWEPEKGKRQRDIISWIKKKSNRQTGGPSCLYQVLYPTHWKGQPHPQAPRRSGAPGEGSAPTTLCYGRSGKQGRGPAGAQGAAMGGRPQGARREARVERPRALRAPGVLKGASWSPAARPTGPNWDRGGRRERFVERSAGAAREQLSSRSVTSEDALPLVRPHPSDPSQVPGLKRPVRVFSPLGREGGWWPRRPSVPTPGLFLTPCRLRGSPGSRNAVAAVQITPRRGLGSRGRRFICETFPCISFPGTPGSRPSQLRL